MHEPVIHGVHFLSGSAASLSKEGRLFGDRLLRHVLNIKKAGNLASLKMTRALPDGGYVTAISMGGVDKLLYYLEEEEDIAEAVDALPSWRVPMLYSGRVTGTRFNPSEAAGPALHISESTRRRLKDFATIPETKPARFASERHAIAPGSRFEEFGPAGQGKFNNTQYLMHRAGWYSGSMAQAVQIVSGYGKQGDKYTDMAVPVEVLRAAEQEFRKDKNRYPDLQICDWLVSGLRDDEYTIADWLFLPGYVGFPQDSGVIRYQYRWDNTDGISFDSSRNPWLINVSRRGVYAMPLPLVSVTRTQAFRNWIDEIGDTEVMAVLERFGGLPSGEDWPAGDNLKHAEKAGIVMKIAETTDFYANLAYGPTVGWAFGVSGREAFNTCYTYQDDPGWQVGYAYKLNLNLAAVRYSEWRPEESPTWQNMVRRYLSELFGWAGQTGAGPLIRYKTIRAGFDAVLSRAIAASKDVNKRREEEPAFWLNLQQPPIATHSAILGKIDEGVLFPYGGTIKRQPQIKFPEPHPALRFCRSHDFSPMEQAKNENPRCNTIMYGYYIGDSLKVVKYFREPRKFVAETESDFEECMIVGAWTEIRTSGQTETLGAFYTTDFDLRDQVAPSVTVTQIKGEDRGMQPAGNAAFGFMPWPYQNGTMSRSRFFSTETEANTVTGQHLQIAICLPMFERCAALHAFEYTDSGTSYSYASALHSIADPTSYGLWTYHWTVRYMSVLDRSTYLTARPQPYNANIFWLEGEFYNPGPCSDFADQGGWRNPIEDVTGEVARMPGSTGDASGGWRPGFRAESHSERKDPKTRQQLDVSLREEGDRIGEYVDRRYFENSPDEYGFTMTREAGKNQIGDREYAVVSEGNAQGEYAHWGNTVFVDEHNSIPCFIGVVSE